MIDVEKIADEADMIVNGYAFRKCELGYRILNLEQPEHALVISKKGETIETTMCDIEIQIVKDYFARNRRVLEDD